MVVAAVVFAMVHGMFTTLLLSSFMILIRFVGVRIVVVANLIFKIISSLFTISHNVVVVVVVVEKAITDV